jgi:hypothetical protein
MGTRKGSTRLRRRAAAAVVLSIGFLLAGQSTAGATLQLLKPNPSDTATFSGNGGVSTDGLGQIGTGGTIQAQVPAGSTVQQAYLYGTYFGSAPDATARTIDFDGTSVLLELTATQSGNTFFFTARANVTSQVATKVGSGGGITDFAVNTDPFGLDGVALVVIFSNPAFPQTTVAVLDGGAAQAGDTATFNFADPIDPTQPGFVAAMALGSGFSFQGGTPESHFCGGGQTSIVNINSQLLTNCAGNYDDGQPSNGALITVGGVGDSFDNPTPPDNPPTDDELYNLVPFLKQGDTQLVIQTSNPSNDDNLFLAVIATSAAARVTTEICDNGVDDDGDGLVDQNDPDCQAPAQEICDNGVDDDGDGLVDGDDPDCPYTQRVAPRTTTVAPSRLVRVRVGCSQRTACKGRLTLQATVPAKASASQKLKRVVTLGERGYRLRAGGRRGLRVRLSKRGVRLVRRAGRLRVQALSSSTPGTVPRVKTLVLKAPRRR